MTVISVILVLFVANGAPILARNLLGDRLAAPIDAGRVLADGERLFGPNKTWRGLIAAPLLGGPVAALLGLGIGLGLAISIVAMLGDLLTSFLKRRAGLKPSDQAVVLDQTPESLLPVLAVADKLNLSVTDIVIVTVAFVILGSLLSRVLFRVGVRHQPH